MKKLFALLPGHFGLVLSHCGLAIFLFLAQPINSDAAPRAANDFRIKAFHIDLRIQVMKMPALMELAHHLHEEGINTIIMEWEASYPYSNESVISNDLAYSRTEVKDFIDYCAKLGIDVIPLQQTFGHVEYILRHYRYAALREDPKDFSQVCPSELPKDSVLFRDLIKDMISLHRSPYVHIGGDETFLLGHCPKCQKKVAEEGLSKLYFDYIKMICDVVVGLGKKPVLWADIALKYPEYIQLLPKETVFVDWNYGWSLDRFGDHKKLLASGYEVWGAAAIRSDPDNFYLEKWKKHFDNISTFIPETRAMNYAGMVMTSWSTSGSYSAVFDAHEDPLLYFPVRRVYPLSGFNLLIDAYATSLKTDSPLNTDQFITGYCKDHYGLGPSDANLFIKALFMTPYPVINGQIKEKSDFSLNQLVDSAGQSLRWLQTLAPTKNKGEFAHYILMAEIRLFYLQVLQIEAEMNTDEYTIASHEKFHARLMQLKDTSLYLNQKFADLNKDFLYASEIDKENDQRNYKLAGLLDKTSPGSRDHDPVVKTSQGYIKGLNENGIAVFKGIPYAQPPVANLRFMPPANHTPWTDTLNTVEFGPSAMQPSGANASGSEDCLYLNLYTPKTDDHKRAVVVWVHGGSMTNGSGKGMNGHAFADNDDIVTITINYRLGAFGFLDMADLNKKYSQSGNLGLLDVIAALHWVHENIAAFGGDPDRVTIMGESAGAKLLSAVMVAPASKGLYTQAVLESGSVQCIRDTLTAKNARTLLLQHLGLGPNDAGKLLTMPAGSIIKAQAEVCDGIGGNSFFGPVYDGITIKEDGYRYAREGKLSGIKAIIGTNENEGAAFVGKNEPDPNTTVFQPLFRSNAPMPYAYYQGQLKTDSPYSAMVKTLTQYMYQIHSYRFAGALTDAGATVWMYRYKYRNGKPFGARHGDELHYIWGAAEIMNSNADAAKKQLAQSLHSAWVSFIKTGDPDGSSIPRWPAYSTKERQVMVFDETDKADRLEEIYNDPAFPSAVFVLR